MKDINTNTLLTSFGNRLSKLGIEIEYFGNYPWVYLYKINGKIVKEKQYSEHGFTIIFHPLKGETPKFLDIHETFKLIRKYNNNKIEL